jgi:DNA-binding NarL/FixJ family response regulator
MDPVSVLVVDDYEPFRRLIRSMLASSSFRIIGEAADGLEAVQKAALGQPDLILLDIGLPKLNGLKAAEQIREVASHTKVLFLSQESSVDVVQHALGLGALGYLHKTRTHQELLPAIESVLAGKQFVSTALETSRFSESTNKQFADCHQVEFYSEEAAFLAGVSAFAAASLRAGDPVIVMATRSHREDLIRSLRSDGFDIDDAVQQGRYISLDAVELLSTIMVGGLPDGGQFFEGLSGLIRSASAAVKKRNPRIAICGECVGILCAEGNANAAVRLEKIGNDLVKTHNVEILCSYPLSAFQGDENRRAFASVCSEHSAVRIR